MIASHYIMDINNTTPGSDVGSPPYQANNNSLLRNFNLDSKEFKKLLDTQSLVDCTLACDGGKISAHKVVLSACSSYLAAILADHPVEHPIIILPELNIDDVRTLVHYMYTGELLKSDTQHSTSLLKTAAILSVNSLNDFLSGTTAANQSTNNNNINTATSTIITSSGTANNNSDANQSVISNSINAGRVQRQHLQQQRSKVPYSYNNNNNTPSKSNQSLLAGGGSGGVIGLHSGNSLLANNTISVGNICSSTNSTTGNKPEFQFKCPVCENTIRQTICSFEYHMQKVHNVTSFSCEICHKPFASLRYVLTDHMRRCHRWKADQNLQC